MVEFLNQQPLYIVLFIVLSVWAGIFVYLLRMENRVKKLEQLSRKNR